MNSIELVTQNLKKDNYELIHYSYHKVEIKHLECEEIFFKSMNTLKKNTRNICPTCYMRGKNLSIAELISKEDNSYEYISGYTGVHNKISILHKICGSVLEVAPYSFLYLHGSRCKCNRVIDAPNEISSKDFKYFLEKFYKDKFILKNDTEVINLKCGHSMNLSYSDFIMSTKKCHCGNNSFSSLQKSTDQVKFELFMMFNNNYELASEYVNNKDKVMLKHKCGNSFLVRYNDFQNGRSRCPKCSAKVNVSRAFDEAIKYLEEKFVFEKEYKFEDCKYKKILSFDYAIFIKKKLVCLIEFQGMQHFKNCFGESSFNNQIKRDKIKEEFCKKNNIKLICIRYDSSVENQINQLREIK